MSATSGHGFRPTISGWASCTQCTRDVHSWDDSPVRVLAHRLFSMHIPIREAIPPALAPLRLSRPRTTNYRVGGKKAYTSRSGVGRCKSTPSRKRMPRIKWREEANGRPCPPPALKHTGWVSFLPHRTKQRARADTAEQQEWLNRSEYAIESHNLLFASSQIRSNGQPGLQQCQSCRLNTEGLNQPYCKTKGSRSKRGHGEHMP